MREITLAVATISEEMVYNRKVFSMCKLNARWRKSRPSVRSSSSYGQSLVIVSSVVEPFNPRESEMDLQMHQSTTPILYQRASITESTGAQGDVVSSALTEESGGKGNNPLVDTSGQIKLI